MTITVYVPSDAESDRFLANVEKWVQHLRRQNVSADIAAYIARDFLSPMRIRPLDGDSPQAGQEPPAEQTSAGACYIPQTLEDEDTAP